MPKEESLNLETFQDGVPSVLKKLQKWGDYPSSGSPVVSTKFIPMKTPLSVATLSAWSQGGGPRHSLTIPGFLNQQKALGRKVGLLLDLCNHECLYLEDIPTHLEYRHVRLVAKEVPSREHVREVAAIAEAFWEKNPNSFIAVHCAYGFNRTGFVLSSYLVENRGYSVGAALTAFGQARPPGVKHEKFKMELQERYPLSLHSEHTNVALNPRLSFDDKRKEAGSKRTSGGGSKWSGWSTQKQRGRSFRGSLIWIGRKVFALGWQQQQSSSVQEKSEEIQVEATDYSNSRINECEERDVSKQYDENESLGSVDRQLFSKIRWDLVRNQCERDCEERDGEVLA